MKDQASSFFQELQKSICAGLHTQETSVRFSSDIWERKDSSGKDGGGGDTRVIADGEVFEKGGVNFSRVYGTAPESLVKHLGVDGEMFATGVSLVIHPYSPMVPTVHANFRFLELGEHSWFGGGMDLTPYYLFEEDAKHFHQVIKESCDRHNKSYYKNFKEHCDQYFYIKHRRERRGIGGIFFDYLGKDSNESLPQIFDFVKDIGSSFVNSYLPIVEKRKSLSFTEEQKDFQLIRRGRYVEFNLVYDRGTKFGLETDGRTESILMSLPKHVKWEYNSQPQPGSQEAKLIEVLRSPRDWI